MTNPRPPFPADLWQEFNTLADSLAYSIKGERSRWKLMRRLLAYAKEHPDLFRS